MLTSMYICYITESLYLCYFIINFIGRKFAMRMNNFFGVMTLLMLCMAMSYAAIEGSASFCWRNTKTRGVGTIPGQCQANEDKLGLLCYDKCPANFKRFVLDCHSTCPNLHGWQDQGLFCRLTQYGRGSGYPWKFGDGFNDNGMKRRCEAANGRGKCQKNGLIYYPKCRLGYHNVGCCICRPNVPNCGSFGLNKGIDLSCAKRIQIGNPENAECPSDKLYDAGLCYSRCPEGYTGVGPVCWLGAPKGWVECGMGAAQNTQQCVSVIFDQVSSVGALALNIATFGSSASAKAAAKAGKDATKILEMKKKFKQMKQIYDNSLEIADLLRQVIKNRPKDSKAGDEANKIKNADVEKLTPQDMVRMAAELASLLDPTGIADVVKSYSYPTCDKIKTS